MKNITADTLSSFYRYAIKNTKEASIPWKIFRILASKTRVFFYNFLRLSGKTEVKTTHDTKMIVSRSNYMSGCIYWQGYHHYHETTFIKINMKDHENFIDIGSNQGEFALLAAKISPNGKIFCFEPQSKIADDLKKNVELNNFSNVEISKKGLWSSDKVLPIYTSNEMDLHGGLHEGLHTVYKTTTRAQEVETIELTTLDNFFLQHKLKRVDWLKIDIEGSELEALKGAEKTLKEFLPKIIIEINDETFNAAGYTRLELKNYLISCGYTKFFNFPYPKKSSEDFLTYKIDSSFNALIQ